MPTGYTYKLYEGEQPFREFFIECCRAFGGVSLNYQESNSPIPDVKVPDRHHADSLEQARAKLEYWETLDSETLTQLASEHVDREREKYGESVREAHTRKQRYLAMQNKVAMWTPPTEEHARLKEFMLNQLAISMDDCNTYGNSPNESERDPEAYRQKQIAAAKWDIDYHSKHWAEEVERTHKRNVWWGQVLESLNSYDPPTAQPCCCDTPTPGGAS